MAELATIARPYAEALFAAGADEQTVEQLTALGSVAADDQLQQFALHPKTQPEQVLAVLAAVVQAPLQPRVQNLLAAMLDNGRVQALPEVARQLALRVAERSGVAEAHVISAFPLDAAQESALRATLEKRFGRTLALTVEVDASLIGGVRAEVGDQVLDLSVRARLERMRQALVA